MSDIIDARGLNCPEPVILAKRQIDRGDEQIVVLVDNRAARQNVGKLGSSRGYEVTVVEEGDQFKIILHKGALDEDAATPPTGVAVLIKGDVFGEADRELGQILMKNLLYTLNEIEGIEHIIFMNRAVHLTTEGSPVLEHLESLQEKGISILSCGICLDFYQKKQQLAVGTITNMYTAMEILAQSAKTLTI